jgi:hypothetical protein
MLLKHIWNVICNKAGFLYFIFMLSSLRLAGATLVDRVQIMEIQEQKNSIIEAQRKTQYDAPMQSAKTALAGLITPPPTGTPAVFQLQVPSPPSSPDEERNELTTYLQQFGMFISSIFKQTLCFLRSGSSQGGYFNQTPVFQGAQTTRFLITILAPPEENSAPPASAQVAGSASVAPPLISDTKMDCSVCFFFPFNRYFDLFACSG